MDLFRRCVERFCAEDFQCARGIHLHPQVLHHIGMTGREILLADQWVFKKSVRVLARLEVGDRLGFFLGADGLEDAQLFKNRQCEPSADQGMGSQHVGIVFPAPPAFAAIAHRFHPVEDTLADLLDIVFVHV